MTNRRQFLKLMGLMSAHLVLPTGCTPIARRTATSHTYVNDVHSRLNRTRVSQVVRARSLDELLKVVRRAGKRDDVISVSGARHAMGGQQFCTDSLHIDTRGLDNILSFDAQKGVIEVEAGMQWRPLISWYIKEQSGRERQWGIKQKQTGADNLTLGGALSANIHGRGLSYAPIIEDIVSFDMVTPKGELVTCSRKENAELFKLAIGGYGLFGVIYSVKLQLVRRQKVERVVLTRTNETIESDFNGRISDKYIYGDYQFNTVNDSDLFLRQGVFACYRPASIDAPIPQRQRKLDRKLWMNFLVDAYRDDAAVFDKYAEYYTSTSGQVYWGDLQQLSTYVDDYHHELKAHLHSKNAHSLMLTELYVPRDELNAFFDDVRPKLLAQDANVVYGVVRLIEKDNESFLAWAKRRYACVIFNLGVEHTADSVQKAKVSFQTLIDAARKRGGSYYLTYHRWATKEQVLDCYPQLPEFLKLKQKYDPHERFQSDWYSYYKKLFQSD